MLNDRIAKDKKVHESQILSLRKKMDEAMKALLDHEQCANTILMQKRRINALKKKNEELENKMKWTWKDLVRRRGIIEDEKVDVKNKMLKHANSALHRLYS